MHRTLSALALLLALAALGCDSTPARFRTNMVYVHVQEKSIGEPYPAELKQNVATVVTALFGTPDEPVLPGLPDADLTQVIDPEGLRIAAGPVRMDQQGLSISGLYRRHCVHCHGVTGDGSGPTASFLNPYPRDFRLGIFKFKSTPGKQAPPTDDDLHRTLEQGIPGTAMPSFRLLELYERDAILDYVKYLAIRGEVERRLIEEATQLDFKENPYLVNVALRESDPGTYQAQMELVRGIAGEVAQKWIGAAENVTPVPARQADRDKARSIAKGRELFCGAIANCAKCHGNTALGDGQVTDFDDWTLDWLKDKTLPFDSPQIREFVEVGAHEPRNIRPRNLRTGVYRGGRRPIDIFWRVRNGIAGSPMPENKVLSDEEVWNIVDYVLSMPYEALSRPSEEALTHDGRPR